MRNKISESSACFWLAAALILVGATGAGCTLARRPAYENMRWDIRCVDCPLAFSNMSDHSLRFDADGHPHLAYGATHLYHTWHDGIVWRTETVDAARGVGAFASLALDPAGHPHVGYYDAPNKAIKYAWWTGDQWITQTVDTPVQLDSRNGQIALELDSNAVPHIAYYDIVSHVLKYIHYAGETWKVQTVASKLGGPVSLALDAYDLPHVSYLADAGLVYAHWTGEDWASQIVDAAVNDVVDISLALDSVNAPHLIYYTDQLDTYPNLRTIKYAHQTGQGWEIQAVGDPGEVGGIYLEPWHISLALDSLDRPHITYGEVGLERGSLFYAYLADNGWTTRVVDSDGAGWHASIALDPSDRPCISYRDKIEMFEAMNHYGALKVACRENGGWQIQMIHNEGGAGQLGLVLDSASHPHISYAGYYGLKYARWNGGAWDVQNITSSDPRMWYTALALDANDWPHIVYGKPYLQYARWDGTAGITETVANVQVSGASMALDASDTPHVAYSEQGVVEYAVRTSDGDWDAQTVDTSGVWGSPFLALDNSGCPQIVYNASGVQYAYLTNAGWVTQTIGHGWATDMVLDTDGHPHIVYVTTFSQTYWLEYAHRTDRVWITRTIDQLQWYGGSASLDLDAWGDPHIVYYTGHRDYRIKYARWTGSHWDIQVVDQLGGIYMPMETALEVDTTGIPHIAYLDARTNSIKYAYMIPSR